MLKPLEELEGLDEGEEVEVIIRRRVFTVEDQEELKSLLERIPKGKAEMMERVEELYYGEALR